MPDIPSDSYPCDSFATTKGSNIDPPWQDIEYLESQVDHRMFTMTVDEYFAVIASESIN
jgi:hypothetical protein